MSKRSADVARAGATSAMVVDRIRAEAADCEREARQHGLPTTTDFEPTALDCDSIVAAVVGMAGRMPTKAEWAEAGFGYVGSAHYEELARG